MSIELLIMNWSMWVEKYRASESEICGCQWRFSVQLQPAMLQKRKKSCWLFEKFFCSKKMMIENFVEGVKQGVVEKWKNLSVNSVVFEETKFENR